MISNPTIADGHGAVRQLVADGKPVNPALQKLIDEKNRRANEAIAVTQRTVKPVFESHGAANLRRVERMAASPSVALMIGDQEAIDTGCDDDAIPPEVAREIERELGPHPSILIEKPEVIGKPKRNSHKSKLKQRAAEMKAKYTTPGGAKAATEPESAAVAAVPAACPVLAQEVHEFGLDVGHSLVAPALEPLATPPAVRLARAAFVAALPSVALAVQEVSEGHPAPAASPDASVARAVGTIRGIADAIPADPPEAADLLQRTLDYFAGINMTEKKYEEYCEKHAPRLTEAILRHRRAKAIVESVLTPWCEAWEFTGTEEPFVDLARRFHAAIVGVLAEAEKKK